VRTGREAKAETCLNEVTSILRLVALRSYAIDHGLVHLVLAWPVRHQRGTKKHVRRSQSFAQAEHHHAVGVRFERWPEDKAASESETCALLQICR